MPHAHRMALLLCVVASAAALSPASAATGGPPSLSKLLSDLPGRTKITCTLHERTAPSHLDVAGRVEKLRRAAIRDKIRPEKAEERLRLLQATWEKLRAGTDQRFARVYYATPDGKLRLTERGTYLANGEPFYKDEYQYGPDSCMINRKFGAAQLFPNQSIRRGLALENILLWGIPLQSVVDSSKATLKRDGDHWVVRGPVREEYRSHHFQYAHPQVELVFPEKRPWIPLEARLWKNGKLAETATTADVRAFGSVSFPEHLHFEAEPRGRIVKDVAVQDVTTGAAVKDEEFLPIVNQKTSVLDGRNERTVTLALKAGEMIPDRSVSRRIIDQSGVAKLAQATPPQLLWYRLAALCVAVLGAYALLRRRPVAAPPASG